MIGRLRRRCRAGYEWLLSRELAEARAILRRFRDSLSTTERRDVDELGGLGSPSGAEADD